jgi:hypothetical protein
VDAFEPYTSYLLSETFHRHHDKGLFRPSPTGLAAPSSFAPDSLPPYERFAHLYLAFELPEVLAYHRPPQLVQP